VVFGESVADFATGDVTLSGTAGATTAIVTGSGTTYNVAVSGMTTNGTVIASVGAGVAHNSEGKANAGSSSTDNEVVWRGSPMGTLNVRRTAGAITIDADPSDWNLAALTKASRAGQREAGDYALTGYLDGMFYSAGHYNGTSQFPPADRADHTARVWSRHDDTYQYFLARIDDSDIQTPYSEITTPGMNWANDCVETAAAYR
jgi:hypothetical protein